MSGEQASKMLTIRRNLGEDHKKALHQNIRCYYCLLILREEIFFSIFFYSEIYCTQGTHLLVEKPHLEKIPPAPYGKLRQCS